MASDETMRLQMPLLQPAQAQKHVTVNEALMRLDGLVNLVLQSTSVRQPPVVVADGHCWAVPSAALGDWAGRDGMIAVGSNGGWVFIPPTMGMRGFVVDRGLPAIHDGMDWAVGAVTMGRQGSGTVAGVAEGEVNIAAGATVDTGIAVPGNAMVIGATARVTETITGSLSSWRLGTPSALDRFGQGLGTAEGSWARGMLGTPMTYYQPANLIMSATGGDFSGGKVRLAVHWWELRLPT